MSVHLTTEFQNTLSKNDRTKRELYKLTVVIEDFSTILSITEITSGQKSAKIQKIWTAVSTNSIELIFM